MRACEALITNHISFSLALGGNDVVRHPLPADPLGKASRLLVLEPEDFTAADQEVLNGIEASRRLTSLPDALRQVSPAVRVESGAAVRVFPRVARGRAVVHILNWDYDPSTDTVRSIEQLPVRLDLAKLGVGNATAATLYAPGAEPVRLDVAGGKALLRHAGLWSILEMKSPN